MNDGPFADKDAAVERYAEALHGALWGTNVVPGMVIPGGVHRHTTDRTEYEAQREFVRRCVQYAETVTGLIPTLATPEPCDECESTGRNCPVHGGRVFPPGEGDRS